MQVQNQPSKAANSAQNHQSALLGLQQQQHLTDAHRNDWPAGPRPAAVRIGPTAALCAVQQPQTRPADSLFCCGPYQRASSHLTKQQCDNPPVSCGPD
jgi:hypothetical protein